ncbi:MAG: DUF975 family protein [Lachnospiraceae bacterium]|nr:DUF975 family protein [Lachnospiraceae bacterium]
MNVNWKISELKNRGRAAVSRNYWKYLLAALILMLTTGTFPSVRINLPLHTNSFSEDSSFSGSFDWDINGKHYEADDIEELFEDLIGSGSFPVFIGIFTGIFLLVFIISLAIAVFALQPLQCGCQRVFVMGQRYQAYLGNITWPMSTAYMNVVKIMFFRGLYTTLWSLLFIVPGVIKSYEYRMIPYILSEHPEIDMDEAFRLSKVMMDGDKWNAFLLDLSFIGWNLLGAITLGLVRIFYAAPYQYATNSELYTALTWKLAPAPQQQTFGSDSFTEDHTYDQANAQSSVYDPGISPSMTSEVSNEAEIKDGSNESENKTDTYESTEDQQRSE